MAEGSGWNPNQEKEQLSSSPSTSTPVPQPARRFHLLLAEDNLPDALLVREAIHNQGLPLEIHTALDGQQAIEFVARAETDANAPRPDLLLLDLNLPKRDGFEVLRRLRASDRFKNIPVLVMTSSNSPADRTETAELGAHYFWKPPNYEAFLKIGDALKTLLEGISAEGSDGGGPK